MIVEPKFWCIAKTEVLHDQLKLFYDDAGVAAAPASEPADHLSEIAGRVCYMSFDRPRPGGNPAYLANIKGQKHGSVLEHPSWTFIVRGVSRSLSHELVRHRAGWAFSQLSQRYVDESDVDFVVPIDLLPGMKEGQTNFEIDRHAHYLAWERTITQALHNYRSAVARHETLYQFQNGPPQDFESRKAMRMSARQVARSLLPNATETIITMTANARAFRHFLEQRGGVGAEPEIRRLAVALLGYLRDDAPGIFGDYAVADGIITTPHRKV